MVSEHMTWRWQSRCRMPSTDPSHAHTHTHPTTCMQTYESDLVAGVRGESRFWSQSPVAVGLNSAWVNPLWCVFVCVVTFPERLPTLSASPCALPPLRHDLSLYCSQAASAERAARLYTHKHAHTYVHTNTSAPNTQWIQTVAVTLIQCFENHNVSL